MRTRTPCVPLPEIQNQLETVIRGEITDHNQPKPMKSIINGKRYDTETATEIASWWNGCSTSDFNHCSVKLYQAKSGNWFIAGTGGALSSYAESHEGGRSRSGGSAIRPVNADEARQWLEDHNEHKALEKHFATQITDA